jgi:two-component system, OmpR family, sensor kinase
MSWRGWPARAWAGLAGARQVPARLPLRVKLVVAVLALVVLALVGTGVAGATALRGYLLTRVDNQLPGNAQALARDACGGGGPGFRGGPEDRGPQLGGASYLRCSAPDGRVVSEHVYPPGVHRSPPRLPTLGTAKVEALGTDPFTVPSQGSGHDWRVFVAPLADRATGNVVETIAVGIALDDVDSTVARLIRIDVVVGLVVLALLAGLAYLAVRSSLRRLVEVETTAGAIAAGDLTRRVPGAEDGTEVGRLAAALNSMLAQIEAAFRDRQASEASARASEERMRRFVADASHELRTPLTSIRGFAELHRQGAVPTAADVTRAMRRIEGEATRMGLLVDDLLLLARLDQQRPLEQRPVDLLTLATDAVHDARALSAGHPVDLRAAGGGDAPPPVVLGDEARLRQVVANLLSNALTHTPPGTPVTVRVASTADSALLEVTDAGPGLPAGEAQRVFERFYRADPSRARALGGTGLGLSIVAALVAAHGGTVELQTAPGAGATFRVRLPLLRPSAPPRPADSRPALAPTATPRAPGEGPARR